MKGVVLYSTSDAMTPCYGNSAEVRRTYSTVQYERWEEDIMEVSGPRHLMTIMIVHCDWLMRVK